LQPHFVPCPSRLTNERDFPEPATASRCQD
jgi:hypothetical protein